MNIIEAALEWRKDWTDSSDLDEEKQGCHCSVCNLIRACDEYLEQKAEVKTKIANIPEKKRHAPPEPRYDDVYYEGLEQLDKA